MHARTRIAPVAALALALMTAGCTPPQTVQTGVITVGTPDTATATAPLAIELDRDADSGAWTAAHLVGDRSEPLPVAVDGPRFTLTFPGGPAHLEFIDVMGKTYTKGTYHTTAPDGTAATLPVYLAPELPDEFRRKPVTLPDIAGPWTITLADDTRLEAVLAVRHDGPGDLPLILEVDLPGAGPTQLVGTAEPRGEQVPIAALPADVIGTLAVGAFDGTTPVAIHGRFHTDGSIRGHAIVGTWWNTPFTATKR